MKGRLLGVALAFILPRIVGAEVMDKEPTLGWVWASAVFFGCVGFWAWRRGPWLGVVAAALSWAFVWAFAVELNDPSVGPAILREAGNGYVGQVYLSLGLCGVLHLLGIAAHLMKKKPGNRQGKLA